VSDKLLGHIFKFHITIAQLDNSPHSWTISCCVNPISLKLGLFRIYMIVISINSFSALMIRSTTSFPLSWLYGSPTSSLSGGTVRLLAETYSVFTLNNDTSICCEYSLENTLVCRRGIKPSTPGYLLRDIFLCSSFNYTKSSPHIYKKKKCSKITNLMMITNLMNCKMMV